MTFKEKNDNKFMQIALREAHVAYENNEVPVGAVVVDDDSKVISSAFNKVEMSHNPTAHAEIAAISKASEILKNKTSFSKCTIYVTLEPCTMCAGAIIGAGFKRLVFGAFNELPLGGTASTSAPVNLFEVYNSSTFVKGGVLEYECGDLLKIFFSSVRSRKYACCEIENSKFKI